jgi:DNA polymerase-2
MINIAMENPLKGFILTSSWQEDEQFKLQYYCSTDAGPVLLKFDSEKFVFFIGQDVKTPSTRINYQEKNIPLKSFEGQAIRAIYTKSSKDFFRLKSEFLESGVRLYESDIWPQDRFLMERFINGQLEISGKSYLEGKILVFENPSIRSTHYNPKFTTLSVDIETGVDGSLYSIGVQYYGEKSLEYVYMLSDVDKLQSDQLQFYSSEKKLILAFLDDFFRIDPDIIIGWHVVGFDINFLINKCFKLKINFNIGRDNKPIVIDEKKGLGFFTNIKGRVIIDGPPAMRSAFYQFKNFKLETVASSVLGTSKDIASDSGKVSEIERRFKDDKVALAKYNLLDCTLVTDIYKKLSIIEFMVERVRISGMLIDRLGISTAALDHVYLPLLHRKGFVAPNSLDMEKDEQSTGGMVIEPKTGMHKNVAIFDFKSLYPTIIRTFNIEPLSRVQADINPLRTPINTKFSKTEHILPKIIENLMEQRFQAKQSKNKSLNLAIKILMNSFYGLMGSYRCRFYHADLPSSITQTGHWILKQSIEFFENHDLEILYGDTDSIFVKLPEHISDTDKFSNEISSKLTMFLKDIILDEFGAVSYLELEFEKMYSKLFFTSMRGSDIGAKKRYVGSVNHELEFVGMEYIRSDWTDLAKKFQYELYQHFFNDEPIEIFIKSFIQDLKNSKFDDLLVYTKRLSKDPKEYTKNIPQHVKAALMIDHKGPYRLKEVSYVVTVTGAIPIQNNPQKPDYEQYIDKQIKPIAEQVLKFQDTNFDSIHLGDQLTLF